MLRQRTSAALAVLSFPGEDPRHGGIEFTQDVVVGAFPHVRCRLDAQEGTETGSEDTVVDELTGWKLAASVSLSELRL